MQWEWAFFTNYRSETTEPILMKLATYNYRYGTTYHAKRHFDSVTWVVSANSQFATVRFLSFLIFSSCAQVDDLCVIRRLSTQWCGREWTFSSQTCKILKRLYYQNYCIDSRPTFAHNKDHQVVFVGCPNTHPAIQDVGRPPCWKKTLNCDISSTDRFSSTDCDEIWYDDTYWPLERRDC